MTASYVIPLTCPQCGSDVEHVAEGHQYPWRRVAALACSECRWTGALTVELVNVGGSSYGQTTRIERERRAIEREGAMA